MIVCLKSYDIEGLEFLILFWIIATNLLIITSACMVAQYDAAFEFICSNCGTCNDDHENSCFSIFRPCGLCCSSYNNCVNKCKLPGKIAFALFTIANLLVAYIFAYK